MSHANHSITLRAVIPAQVGMLGRVMAAIGEAGGEVGGVDIVRSGKGAVTRDVTVYVRDDAHAEAVLVLQPGRVLRVRERVDLVGVEAGAPVAHVDLHPRLVDVARHDHRVGQLGPVGRDVRDMSDTSPRTTRARRHPSAHDRSGSAPRGR